MIYKNLKLIAAMDEHQIIGRGNKLPWTHPRDIKFFKDMTIGKTVLMGRKTFESIGCPLPYRNNLVLSRDPAFSPHGVTTYSDMWKALRWLDYTEELWVIGGRNLYEMTMPLAGEMFITWIHGKHDGDVYFPDIDYTRWNSMVTSAYPEMTFERFVRNERN